MMYRRYIKFGVERARVASGLVGEAEKNERCVQKENFVRKKTMKNFGTDGGKQYSYFAVRLYCEEKNKVLDMCVNALKVRHYAFICHDKDIWKDSTEGHNAGEPKKAHYHIVLNMEQKTSWKVLQKQIYSVLGKDCGAQLRDIKDTENATLYLTHNTKEAQKEGKYQYELSEVVSDDYNYWLSEETKRENKSEHIDAISEFVNVVIDNNNTITRESMWAFQQEYGRDFILNFGKIMQYLEAYTGRKQSTLFTDPDNFVQAVTNTIMVKLENTWGLSTIIRKVDDNAEAIKETETFIINELRNIIK